MDNVRGSNERDIKFFETILELTAYPERWILIKELESIIYHTQSNALEAPSWEKVNEDKGFAKGLAYIVNLRDTVKRQKEIYDAAV